MTREEEILDLELQIITIFKKDFIPSFLVRKANSLIAKWKMLTGWVEDSTPAITEYPNIKQAEIILETPPKYQNNDARRH